MHSCYKCFYISQLVRFAWICNIFHAFMTILSRCLQPQGYHFHKFLKTLTNFYYHYKDLVLIGTIFYRQEIWSRSVFPIHDVFCVSVWIWNGLYTTDSTFLAISRLTTRLTDPTILLFIIHVYSVLHFTSNHSKQKETTPLIC